jgi:hypothetical protein
MKKIPRFYFCVFVAFLVLSWTACAPQKAAMKPTNPAVIATPSTQTFVDPFAYCGAVGTVDAPDARYTCEAIPDAVIDGFKKAAGLEGSTESMEQFKKSTIWRCMDGKVLACNFGANLPCDSKANTDQTSTQAMQDFCKESPDSEFIPMSVTGHNTIYSWHCVDGSPKLLDQIVSVDAAGYLANIWYAMEQTK